MSISKDEMGLVIFQLLSGLLPREAAREWDNKDSKSVVKGQAARIAEVVCVTFKLGELDGKR